MLPDPRFPAQAVSTRRARAGGLLEVRGWSGWDDLLQAAQRAEIADQ